MRSSKAAAVALLVFGLALVGGNLYETLRRSTIPLSLEGEVRDVELRREKHPGIDDVHLLEFSFGSVHVDAAVAERIGEGDILQKDAWSRELTVNGARTNVEFSRDFRGMLVVMPVVTIVLVWLLAKASSPRRMFRARR